MQAKELRVGIAGHGVVGSGVAEILLEQGALLERRLGAKMKLVRIADLKDFSNVSYAELFTKDAMALAQAPDIDVLVESMGGIRVAKDVVKSALSHGKHVVTPNKALVAACGEELCTVAEQHNVRFLYEASVGGGIPVIQPLRQCLACNELTRVAGILNGTTNYILTRMRDGGDSFDVALKEAQALGYAEANPDDDILGYDPRRKVCILAHVAFGAPFDDSGIFTCGITGLSRQDMLYARELGRSVKLLAIAGTEETGSGRKGWRASVAPAMIPADHPLSAVNDVFNAIFVHGEIVDNVMFYGRGAGHSPTASAIVGDLADILLHPCDPALTFHADLDALPALGAKTRLFTRVCRALTEETRQAALAAFPGARLVQMEGAAFADEFALITEEDVEQALRDRFAAFALPHGELIRYINP